VHNLAVVNPHLWQTHPYQAFAEDGVAIHLEVGHDQIIRIQCRRLPRAFPKLWRVWVNSCPRLQWEKTAPHGGGHGIIL
jgi:hypothetical protein